MMMRWFMVSATKAVEECTATPEKAQPKGLGSMDAVEARNRLFFVTSTISLRLEIKELFHNKNCSFVCCLWFQFMIWSNGSGNAV